MGFQLLCTQFHGSIFCVELEPLNMWNKKHKQLKKSLTLTSFVRWAMLTESTPPTTLSNKRLLQSRQKMINRAQNQKTLQKDNSCTKLMRNSKQIQIIYKTLKMRLRFGHTSHYWKHTSAEDSKTTMINTSCRIWKD